MPLPSSGELRLRADIALEVDGVDTGNDVSLGTLSDTAGFTEPDSMSEFYSYSSVTPPYFDGGLATANITDTYMTVVAPAVYNPDNLNIQRGFYFGTSTTATSNTFYDMGNTTGSGLNYSKQFTGLSGSTTYYIWGVVRDTASPARFTEVLTPMKTQATLATLNYSTYTGGNYNVSAQSYTSSSYAAHRYYYTHSYYGNTQYYSLSKSISGGAGFSGYATGASRFRYRSGVSTTNKWRVEGGGGPDSNQTIFGNFNSCSAAGISGTATYTNSKSGDGNVSYTGFTTSICGYQNASGAVASHESSLDFNREQTFSA